MTIHTVGNRTFSDTLWITFGACPIINSSNTSTDCKYPMALSFQPKVGSVLMCNFEGFLAPEMVKKRPVVVVARNRSNTQLVTVVPLSTTAPDVLESHHHPLPFNRVPVYKGTQCWAKCDMLATVSIGRMDRLKDKNHARVIPVIPAADLVAIRLCVVNALQLQNVIVSAKATGAAVAAVAAVAVATAAAVTTIAEDGAA